ncbi:MAG TPA: hypothetical protein VGM76_11955, partial [Lacipirellulaceae bacterium]
CAESSNPDDYLDTLRERFAKSVDRGPPKGAGQLARTISKLAIGEWSVDLNTIGGCASIIPVLVCSDEMLGSGTHPWFLANEFRAMLRADAGMVPGELIKGPMRVSNLIVLTIELLECLEASIENFSLGNLLRDYSTACPDRINCLRTYIWQSEYGKKLFANRSLAESAVSALERACELTGISPSR